jgi:hypothetical protein
MPQFCTGVNQILPKIHRLACSASERYFYAENADKHVIFMRRNRGVLFCAGAGFF